MFVRRSRYTALHRRYQQVIAQRGDAIDAAVGHVREIARLAEVVDGLREELTAVKAELVVVKADKHRLAGRVQRLWQLLEHHRDHSAFDLARRLQRALRAAARYLNAYHQEKRRADRLQQQLDDALGLNEPAVQAGTDWQTRRDQKMRFDK